MLTQELIVAGFHRSGTSLVAQVLHRAGLFLGDDLIGAMPSNPFGHFEDRRVVQMHDGILADNGRNWQVDEPFIPVITPRRWQEMESIVTGRRVAHSLWGFKDPRVCLFLPHWTAVMPDAKVVGIFRHPADTTRSLQRRHMREWVEGVGPEDVHRRFFEVPDLGLKMWLLYNGLLVRYLEDHPESSILVPFEAVTDGIPIVEELRSRWGMRLGEVDTLGVFDPAVTSERRWRPIVHDEALVDDAIALWKRLTELSASLSDDRIIANEPR